ncbi:hypothetical protein GCM10010211_82440 [Streptomyces albospinus]|uniref:Tetratricopeptide repeat protein n=1 Tax=Streptomyces albospinus TaxID=285515 RepID=A0ABQ2VP10_9ACTN|nr:hypothetical protein GCM10010211_82440 [Streptomyces albospinus]
MLLIARSVRGWWSPLKDALRDRGLPTRSIGLSSLTEEIAPEKLFCAARDGFAKMLAIDDGLPGTSPLGIHQWDRFRHVLALHTSALVEVCARLLPGPERTAAISSYLLDRERRYWEDLYEGQRIRLPVGKLALATYTAALTSALDHDAGLDALACLDRGSADSGQVLADHATAYPPFNGHTVLEPLHPHWLAQDYLALITPGDPLSFETSEPWALRAPVHLLATPTQSEEKKAASTWPAWLRPAVSTLIETSQRWPHIATGQLVPLLTDHPHLALAAGKTLTAITDIAHLPTAFAADVASSLQGLGEYLHMAEDAEELEKALEATQLALDLYHALGAHEPADAFVSQQAESLSALSSLQRRTGQLESASQTAARAVGLYRRLAHEFHQVAYARELAVALYRQAQVLASQKNWYEALAAIKECLDIYRAEYLATPNSLPTTVFIDSLYETRILHAEVLASLGRTEEADEIRRQLTTGRWWYLSW